ncbi:MAG: hypothetical protein RLZ60_1749, partial [Pseudomonadota bacterium]
MVDTIDPRNRKSGQLDRTVTLLLPSHEPLVAAGLEL